MPPSPILDFITYTVKNDTRIRLATYPDFEQAAKRIQFLKKAEIVMTNQVLKGESRYHYEHGHLIHISTHEEASK